MTLRSMILKELKIPGFCSGRTPVSWSVPSASPRATGHQLAAIDGAVAIGIKLPEGAFRLVPK